MVGCCATTVLIGHLSHMETNPANVQITVDKTCTLQLRMTLTCYMFQSRQVIGICMCDLVGHRICMGIAYMTCLVIALAPGLHINLLIVNRPALPKTLCN